MDALFILELVRNSDGAIVGLHPIAPSEIKEACLSACVNGDESQEQNYTYLQVIDGEPIHAFREDDLLIVPKEMP